MSTEAGLGHGSIETVLAAHLVASPRGYVGECCICGWESDLEQPPKDQGIVHVAEQVRVWLREALVSPEVVEAANWRIKHYGPLDAEPFRYSRYESPGHAALSAAAETLGAK